MQATIDSGTERAAKLEQDVKDLDDQCALWRAKVRHRHRALEMPQFAKSKKGQKEKEAWMKQKALDDSLGAAGYLLARSICMHCCLTQLSHVTCAQGLMIR
eukprot:COSAG02_NODE_7554_length_2963_cov_1.869064_1_plen_101_part_00